MVSSPVMFDSLPTGVWSGGNVGPSAISGGLSYSEGKPWQTLLFRPHASSNANYGKGVSPGHPGDNNPRDHYLLDLFFMPVVEPYAISEPLSTAGRINLNYQIVPFTNITRATGMHAVMKGEFMTAIPLGDTDIAKNLSLIHISSIPPSIPAMIRCAPAGVTRRLALPTSPVARSILTMAEESA